MLAGVNGAGKSSIVGAAIRDMGGEYYNPDEAARQIMMANPRLGQIDANGAAWEQGRKLLERAIGEGLDFTFETTLGGNTMPRLLAEAAKLSNDIVLQGVIETIVQESPILQMLPFIEITGNGLTYNRENTNPNATFFDVGDTWTEGTPTFTQITTPLKIIGGDADVDNYLLQTRSNVQDLQAAVVRLRAKAVQQKFEDTFLNGDTAVDSKSFDGIDKLTTGGQALTMGANGATLTLGKLDELVDAIKGGPPAMLLMSKRTRRTLNNLARTTGSLLQSDRNDFGQMVQFYDGIPVAVSDYISDAKTVGTSGSFLHELSIGFRFVFKRDRTMLALMMTATLYSLGVSAFVFMLPVFAERTLAVGPVELGWLWSGLGVGMLVTSVWMASKGQHDVFSRFRMVAAAMAVGGLAVCVLSTLQTPMLATALIVVIGACTAVFMPIVWGILQEVTPEPLLGRVFTTFSTGGMASSMAGMAGFGWAADHIGPAASLGGISLILLLTAATAWLFSFYNAHSRGLAVSPSGSFTPQPSIAQS